MGGGSRAKRRRVAARKERAGAKSGSGGERAAQDEVAAGLAIAAALPGAARPAAVLPAGTAASKKRKSPTSSSGGVVSEGVLNLVAAPAARVGDRKKQELRDSRREALLENKLWRRFDRSSASAANAFFSSYYELQLGLAAQDAAAFHASLARGLPVTFRVNRGRFPLLAAALERRLAREFQFVGTFKRIGADKVLSTGEVVKPVRWLRDAYQLGTDRNGFVKAAALLPLYETVAREARLGHLARQGIASMVPALVLRPRSADVVLDMCGAPGSKSEQLLQMMGEGAPGCVVTNDSDPKRLASLLSRLAKIPHRSLAVTCNRGEDIYRKLGAEVFDGCICDVPCTGDGTIRKFPFLWRVWRAKRAVHLHPLQLQLAMSAASLLKVGARMVYSTCSINPIEDEAVVAALLAAAKGALRLVQFELAGFTTRPGLSTWSADEDLMKQGAGLQEEEQEGEGQEGQGPQGQDREQELEHDTGDEDEREEAHGPEQHFDDEGEPEDERAARKRAEGPRAAGAAEAARHKRPRPRKGGKRRTEPEPVVVTASMRPPSAQQASGMRLELCARILHHDNDTEGFFVALIEKVAPWELDGGSERKAKAGGAIGAASAEKLLKQVGFKQTTTVLSAASSQSVLRNVGFNPNLASDAAAEAARVKLVPASAALAAKLAEELGCSAPLLASGCLKLQRRPEALAATLVSPALARILDLGAWVARGVSFLHAGVDIAVAPAKYDKASDSPRELGPFEPCSSGALELAAGLRAAGGDAPLLLEAPRKEDLFAMLQLALAASRASDEDAPDSDDSAEDEGGRAGAQQEQYKQRQQQQPQQLVSSASKSKQAAPVMLVSIRACVRMLEEQDSDSDDESEREDDQELDPDLCSNPLAAALVAAPVSRALWIALPSAAAALPPPAPEHAPEAKQEGVKARLSAAERRHRKKQHQRREPGAVAVGETARETARGAAAPAPAARWDMFTGSHAEPPFHMVIVVVKVSPNSLRIVSDLDLVVSYGQALQTVLEAEQQDGHGAEEEQEQAEDQDVLIA
jgi:16S rRNA C967 or C1407 C5-methylase (RsmB/RsmF family)